MFLVWRLNPSIYLCKLIATKQKVDVFLDMQTTTPGAMKSERRERPARRCDENTNPDIAKC
jgi:hypothetical protein